MKQRFIWGFYNWAVSERTTRIEVVFHGRVQGVGFRATVAGLARDLPISGWVRNEPDGSVRLQAQGDRDEILRLVQLIEQRMGRLITRTMSQDISTRDNDGGAFRIAQ